jgi:putative transposase
LKKTFFCYFLLLGQTKILYIAPGNPWENGYVESFNSKFWDELLNREFFLHIDELRYVADYWLMDYNHYRPHSSLDYMTPAAFAAKCFEEGHATAQLQEYNRAI